MMNATPRAPDLARDFAHVDCWVFDLDIPVLGNLHLVTPAFFDIGVYLVVLGMGVGLLTSLGDGVDQQPAAMLPEVLGPHAGHAQVAARLDRGDGADIGDDPREHQARS